MNLWRTFFSMILPFPPNTLLIIPICLGNFFSLPTSIFPWAGKNRSGSETEKMKANLMKFLDRRRSVSLQLKEALY